MQRAAQVRNFIVENFLFGAVDQIRDDESFLDSGIVDSTGVLQLIDFLEETYGIAIANEDATPDNLDSIDKISAYLARRLDGSRKAAHPVLEVAEAGGRS
jgi:acyl carrier protein